MTGYLMSTRRMEVTLCTETEAETCVSTATDDIGAFLVMDCVSRLFMHQKSCCHCFTIFLFSWLTCKPSVPGAKKRRILVVY